MLDKIKNVLQLIDYPYRGKVIFSVIGSAIVSLIDMFGVAASYPLLMLVSGADVHQGVQGMISGFFATDDRQRLIVITAALVATCFIAKSLVMMAFRWWQLGFVNTLEKTARTNLFRAYLDVPFIEHRAKQIPDLHTNLVTAVSQAFNQVILGSISFLAQLFTITTLTIVMFVVSPLAALVAIVLFAGAGAFLPMLLKTKLRAVSSDLTEADRISWYASIPAFQAFREMRLFNVADNFARDYSTGATLRAGAMRRSSFFSELPKYLIEVVFVFGVVVLALLLFNLYPAEEAISVMGVFTVAAMRMMPSVNGAIATVNMIRAGSVGLEILSHEVDKIKRNTPNSALPTSGTEFAGDIEVRNLVFGYDREQPVLNKVSLRIPQGSTVAFVGSSGSGKSTLVDVILGLLPVQEGEVLSAGKNIHDDVRAWQSQMGVVPQTVYMIPGSLRDNIAFGLDSHLIDDEAVLRAARDADLGDLVDSLPEGIYEDLGQDGNRLSGGQRQRLGIARALCRAPQLLVLDEATSALDNKTEYRITETINNLRGKVTTIVVAHRLSTIRDADQIYYLKNGVVAGQGTFTELEATVPEFAELVRLGKLS